MKLFLVKLADSAGDSRRDGVTGAIVVAADAAAARRAADLDLHGHASWADATVTEIKAGRGDTARVLARI